MARSTTKVSREDAGREEFVLPEGNNLSADEVLVGDGREAEADITLTDNDDEGSEDWSLPKGQPAAPPRKPVAREETDEEPTDEEVEDARLAYRETDDGESLDHETRSRRARRNARRREYIQGQSQEINELKARMAQMATVMEQMARGQVGLHASTLDQQIAQLEQGLRLANQELADAVKASDGDKYTQVTDLRDQIVGRLYTMKGQRQSYADGGTVRQPQGAPPPQPQPQMQGDDPRIVQIVQSKFEKFRDRFDWFDPDSQDTNCNLVRAIDAELQNNGLARHSDEFWIQMERRLSRYGLKPGTGEAEGDDEMEDRPQRRDSPLGRSVNLPPRMAPTGNNRPTRRNNNGAFQLSDVQRELLDGEGLLPKPGQPPLSEDDVAKRDRIINKWRTGMNGAAR